jgi:hypothetical protein
MGLLVIIGHVGRVESPRIHLPMVLRQFIETHHGTTPSVFHNGTKKADSESISDATRYPADPGPRGRHRYIAMPSKGRRSNPTHRPRGSKHRPHIAMRRCIASSTNAIWPCGFEPDRGKHRQTAAHYHGRIAYPTLPASPNDRLTESGTSTLMTNGVKKA